MPRIVGMDPGFKGGLALLNKDEQRSVNMPVIVSRKTTTVKGKKKVKVRTNLNEPEIRNFLKIAMPDLVIIEMASSMPKQGVTSVFNFGAGWGILRGICAGMSIPYELVRPQAWKKEILAGTDKDKAAAISHVLRRFPYVDFEGEQLNDGQADAFCLAEYGLKNYIFTDGDE